jgi:RNA polymerase sigma-70 factor (ECF subfamily)
MDDAAGEVESTVQLVQRAREGDRDALDRICSRYLGPLRRWARGRLPAWSRDLLDTDDLVQETLLKTVRNFDRFEPRGHGALHGYLRRALDNRIRDEIKRAHRAPDAEQLDRSLPDGSASPLERALGGEAIARYERALARLDEREREAVVARIELGLSYREVAEAVGSPSANAARMMVGRALVRMAEEMDDVR